MNLDEHQKAKIILNALEAGVEITVRFGTFRLFKRGAIVTTPHGKEKEVGKREWLGHKMKELTKKEAGYLGSDLSKEDVVDLALKEFKEEDFVGLAGSTALRQMSKRRNL